MKTTLLLAFLLYTANAICANKIDSLETPADVNAFLGSLNKEYFDNPPLKGDIADSTMQAFYKVDLDNNGLTDLATNGEHLIIVLDKRDAGYELHTIPMLAHYYEYRIKSVANLENEKALLLSHPSNTCIDTMIYKYSSFLDYNPVPAQHKIKSVQLTTPAVWAPAQHLHLQLMKADLPNTMLLLLISKKGVFPAGSISTPLTG